MDLIGERYHGYRIVDEPERGHGMSATHWFNVYDDNGEAFRLAFSVHVDYALAYPDLGHPRDASRTLAKTLGTRWTHGLIDLARFERGEEYREERRADTSGPAAVSEGDLRLGLLQALRRMRRAEVAGRSEILALDVDGVADVLGATGPELRGILSELIAEGLVEAAAASFGAAPEDGACAITGVGLQHLRELEDQRVATLPTVTPAPPDPDFGPPCVFVSYASPELGLAKQVAALVEARIQEDVFVAKRDIDPGIDPLKAMLQKRLPNSFALLALCSRRSMSSGWLWWEASSVWTRNGLVIPLFVDVSAGEFGGPMTLVVQGRTLFDRDDLNEALKAVTESSPSSAEFFPMTDEEWAATHRFSAEYPVAADDGGDSNAATDQLREARFRDMLSLVLELKDAAFEADAAGQRWTNKIASVRARLGTVFKLLESEQFPVEVGEYCQAPDASAVLSRWQLVHDQVEAALLGRSIN